MIEPRRRSLANVVAMTLAAVTTVLLGGYFLIDYVRAAREQRARLETLTDIQIHETCVALGLPVWNIDRPQIEQVIEAMARPQSIYAISVTAAGKTFGRIRDAKGNLIPWNGKGAPPGLMIRREEIQFKDNDIGTVTMYVSFDILNRDLLWLRLRLIATIVIVDVLLILCVYYLLSRNVVRPVQSIERYAMAVSSGRQYEGEGAPIAPAELESLRQSIETMVRLLESRYVELQNEMARRVESEDQRKEMEEALRRSERMSAIGSLVAGVAHEVRNPLFGIAATLDAFEAEFGLSEETAEYMKTLRNDVARLSRLMNDLLEYGRPQEAARHVQPIEPVIAEAVRVCALRAKEKEIEIRQHVEAPLPPVAIDADRMLQVFKNVVENAIEFSKSGDFIAIDARTHSNGASTLVFSIADRGPGFRREDLPHVFEPFFTRRRGGSGLGLAIVQKIVADHGGRVAAENTPGGGARIEIQLPAAV